MVGIVDPTLLTGLAEGYEKGFRGAYPCSGSHVEIIAVEEWPDERHHVYEYPEAGDAAVEGH